MIKKLLLSVLATLLLSTSGVCYAQAEKNEPETEMQAPAVMVNGSVLYVNHAENRVLEIFSLTGTKVATIRIDSPETRIELNLKKGCYILKVDKVVRKISIR